MRTRPVLKGLFCLLLSVGILLGSWTAVEAVPLFQIVYVCDASAGPCSGGLFPVTAYLVCLSDGSCLSWQTCHSTCTKIGVSCSSMTPSCLDF